MANVIINKTSNLDKPISVDSLQGVTFMAESAGHSFVISCMQGGELLNLTGTVTARFMRANNTTVLLGEGAEDGREDYAYIENGKAVVVLHPDCYNVPGRFQLAIFNIADDTVSNLSTTCIYACVGTVQRSQIGDLIDSGEIVPSIDDLIGYIDDCIDATRDAEAAVQHAVRYDAVQSLTDAQKGVARGNIDAANVADVDDLTVGGYLTINKTKFQKGFFRNGEGIVDSQMVWVAGPIEVHEGDTLSISAANIYSYSLVANGNNEVIQVINGTAATYTRPNQSYTIDQDGNLFINVQNAARAADVTAITRDDIDYSAPLYGTLAYANKLRIDALNNSAVKYDEIQSHTDAEKAQARNNIGAASSGDLNTAVSGLTDIVLDCTSRCVSYAVQSKSVAEKAQARNNIGAASSDEFNMAVDGLKSAIHDGYVTYIGGNYQAGLFRDNYGVVDASGQGYCLGPIPVHIGDKFIFNVGSMYCNVVIANGNTTVKTIHGTFATFSQPQPSMTTIDTDGDLWINIRNASRSADATSITELDIDSVLTLYATLIYTNKLRIDALDDVINTIIPTVQTDPSIYKWRYGYYSATGIYISGLNSICTVNNISVKAGDTITCDSGVQFQVGGYLPGSGSFSWDFYRSFSSDAYTFNTDGRVGIGVRYANTREIDNFSILDNLHISLSSGEQPDRFDHRETTNFSGVPTGFYIGRHADVSGFDQDTTYANVIGAWDALIDGNYITKEDLGITYASNHIYCYTLDPNTKKGEPSTNIDLNGKSKPTVIVITGMHGHEKSGTYGLLYMINDLLNHSHEDPILAYLRSNVVFKLVPACNVFGWNYNSRYNQNGVNLNRNFGTKCWDDYDVEDSTEPWQYNYKGSTPFSELESQYIKKLIANNPNATLIVDWHTYGLDTASFSEFAYFSPSYGSASGYNRRIADSAVEMRNLLAATTRNLYEIPSDTNQIFGNAAIEDDSRPTLICWGFEGTNSLSTVLETSPGSTTSFLGERLAKYSADVIKMSAEIFVNYVVHMLGVLN